MNENDKRNVPTKRTGYDIMMLACVHEICVYI